MAIMLTVDQIPAFWEAIKYASVIEDRVQERFRGKYFNRLLYQLLSGKAQCFVGLSNDRRLQTLAITKIVVDEIRDENTLSVVCLYAFEKRDKSTWKEDIRALHQFAVKCNCKAITTWTAHGGIIELIEYLGMKERFKSFIMEVT